jgi:Phosphotransferase enzyme family
MATASPSQASRARLRLPESIQDLTLEWLASALHTSFPGQSLRSATTTQVIPGTATKVLMSLEFGPAPSGPGQRVEICVKGAFDPVMRSYNLGTIFACEAAFYRDVATALKGTLPQCYYADDDGKFGVMILENLAASGARFGDILNSWSAEQVCGLLELLARIHRHGWGWTAGRLPWLHGSDALRNGILGMAAADKFDALIARPRVRALLPTALVTRHGWLAAMQSLWLLDDAQVLCLGHGDAHLGQTYLTSDGTPGLLDWQCTGLMPWAKDVAYFVGGALSIQDRRTHERELLNVYLRALASNGGPVIDKELAWNEYRRQMLQGICWTMVTETMQSLPAITLMNERYLTAIADLDTLQALRPQ